MKRKILIGLIFSAIMLLTTNVKAAYIYADDIEDDSYIIGNYLLTRDKNTSAGYNGELTTQVMLLAARGIGTVYSLDDIKVYYKTFLGEWINGITGEPLSFVPRYFEINVRNLKSNLPKPELNCYVRMWDSSAQFACLANFFESKWTPGSSRPDRLYSDIGENRNVEYYLLKDENGNLPETYVYQDGADEFRENNSSSVRYTPHLITSWEGEMQDLSKFYQIVSRYYYLDGDKKIYSDYSNVANNAVLSILGLRYNTIPKVKAKLYDTPQMYVDSKDASNVIYYNVEFNLENVDTTKYIVRKYDVYTTDGRDYVVESGQYNTAKGLSDSVHWKMYDLNKEKEKWNLGNYFVTTWRGFGEWYEGISYLTASIGSDLPYGTITDVSSEKTYSIRFDKEGETIGTDTIGTKEYYANIYMCLKDDTSVCYYVSTEYGDYAHK